MFTINSNVNKIKHQYLPKNAVQCGHLPIHLVNAKNFFHNLKIYNFYQRKLVNVHIYQFYVVNVGNFLIHLKVSHIHQLDW